MKTSQIASVLAALVLGVTGSAHATTLGINTAPLGSHANPAVASALWDGYTATSFSGLAPGSSSNISTPQLNQTTTFTQFAQGAGVYDFLGGAGGTPGTDLLFTGGNAVTFTMTGTFNFDVKLFTLQIKSSSASDVLFAPVLSINGGSAIPNDTAGMAAGTGDSNTSAGAYRLYQYNWTTSLSSLPTTGVSSFVLSFNSLNPSTGLPAAVTRSFDAIQVDAVPEPSTYAMIALGVGALAWKLRRRKLAII